jgi:cytochrome c551/c552
LFVTLLLISACQARHSDPAAYAAGDAERGASLFTQSINGAPTCSSCHTLSDTSLVGPGMAGYGERAAQAVSGQDAITYTFYSIVAPSRHIVPGFVNMMYLEYERKLDQGQIADLIAFLLSR